MMSEVLESFCTQRAISFLKGALYLRERERERQLVLFSNTQNITKVALGAFYTILWTIRKTHGFSLIPRTVMDSSLGRPGYKVNTGIRVHVHVCSHQWQNVIPVGHE